MKLYYDSNGDGTEDTQISNVFDFPHTITRLDKIGICNFTIRDRLGALYSTWEPLDNIKFKIEDDTSNVLFRGYITDKSYKHNLITLTAHGIGRRLEWKVFNKNYVLAEGLLASVPYSGGDVPHTAILRPDGNGTIVNWLKSTGATYAAHVDDDVEQPDGVGDGLYIYYDDDDENKVIELAMETTTGVTEVTNVRVWIYAKRTSPAYFLDISFDNGATWEGIGLPDQMTSEYTWGYRDWVVSKNQAELNAFEIKLVAPAAIDPGDGGWCEVVYAEITYTGTSAYALGLSEDNIEAGNPAFNWAADQWIDGRDTGILILDDTTGETTTLWAATAIEDNGTADVEVGVVGNLSARTGTDYWDIYDENKASPACTGYITFSGGEIVNTKILKRIRIHLNIALNVETGTAETHTGTIFLYLVATVGNDKLLTYLTKRVSTAVSQNKYWIGEGIDDDGNLVDDFVIEGTHAELSNYFTLDGESDFVSLQIMVKTFGTTPADPPARVGSTSNFATVSIDHDSYAISPIMETIDDSGTSWIKTSNIIWANTGVTTDDRFKIGENTTQILNDVSNVSGVTFLISSTLTKYMARWLRGVFCLDVLNDIKRLEGVHWWEDYINDQIIIAAESDFVDSAIDLTNSNYLFDWEIHDEPNAVSKVHVFGNAGFRIYAMAEDIDSTTPIEELLIDDKILTLPDAQKTANAILAEKQTKRKQIKIPLVGVNEDVTVGTSVTLTMVNPTVAEAQYPISKIEREKGGYIGTDDIWTTIYCGLGGTTLEEALTDNINQINFQTRRNAADRLSTTPFGTGASLTWDDIGGANAAVDARIVVQNTDPAGTIDVAVDALIATHNTANNVNFMIGSANKVYVPCIYMTSTQQDTVGMASAAYTNVDGTDDWMLFELLLPTNRGGLKLYIVTLLLGVRVADGTNYVDRVITSGTTRTARTIIDDDTTNRTAAGDYTYALGSTDMSGYDAVRLEMLRTVADAQALRIAVISIECYYDT